MLPLYQCVFDVFFHFSGDVVHCLLLVKYAATRSKENIAAAVAAAYHYIGEPCIYALAHFQFKLIQFNVCLSVRFCIGIGSKKGGKLFTTNSFGSMIRFGLCCCSCCCEKETKIAFDSFIAQNKISLMI